MKILVTASEIPATTGMAGSPRLFNLCLGLAAQGHRLTLASYTESPGRYDEFLADPATAGVFEEIVILPGPPEAKFWNRQRHRISQEVHFDHRVRYPDYTEQQAELVREMLTAGQFDALYIDGLANAQYVMAGGLPCPAVLDLHDCVTMLYTRKTQAESNWLRKIQLAVETRNVRRWERRLSAVFGAVLVNSPVDEAYFRSVDPDGHIMTIGNGVDSEYFRPGTSVGDPHHLVFTGVLSYGANEDAAVYFAESVLPLIQAEEPTTRFSIVGRAPTERIQALHGRNGIMVAGSVPDVRPFVEAAGIFVCPIRWGAGIKNKLLAALAMEKPVVATRISIQGLSLREEEDLLLGDTPAEMAARVVELIRDPARARRLGQSGHTRVTELYSWESSARTLGATLERLVAERRDAGPTGSIERVTQ
jgi:glycosyltransferase involved in cell wall biosynthesis